MTELPKSEELEPGYFQKVGSNYQYYDTVNIGPGWKARGEGWFDSLTEMSQKDRVTFLNVRTGSKDGYSYCNMDATDNIGRPFRLESFGIDFNYPDPNVSGQHQLDVNAAKFFCTALTRHCYGEFWIRDDQWFILRPHHMPCGYGPVGSLQFNGVVPSSSTMITNGVAHSQNRWRWTKNGIKIPETAQTKFMLTFSEYGKLLLQEMDKIFNLDGRSSEPFPNCAQIEVTMRGKRYSQMKGKYYK